MTTENTKPENPDVIEDLTVSDTETANVKGGISVVDYYLKLEGG